MQADQGCAPRRAACAHAVPRRARAVELEDVLDQQRLQRGVQRLAHVLQQHRQPELHRILQRAHEVRARARPHHLPRALLHSWRSLHRPCAENRDIESSGHASRHVRHRRDAALLRCCKPKPLLLQSWCVDCMLLIKLFTMRGGSVGGRAWSWRARSMLRTHLLACRCGSIMSGQRRACATMMPFSTLAASFGRPAASHLRRRARISA
jgi:hypothetical protein